MMGCDVVNTLHHPKTYHRWDIVMSHQWHVNAPHIVVIKTRKEQYHSWLVKIMPMDPNGRVYHWLYQVIGMISTCNFTFSPRLVLRYIDVQEGNSFFLRRFGIKNEWMTKSARKDVGSCQATHEGSKKNAHSKKTHIFYKDLMMTWGFQSVLPIAMFVVSSYPI